jgi:hypothetical protein
MCPPLQLDVDTAVGDGIRELPDSCDGLRAENGEVGIAQVCSLTYTQRRYATTPEPGVEDATERFSVLPVALEGGVRLVEQEGWCLIRDLAYENGSRNPTCKPRASCGCVEDFKQARLA